MLTDSLHLLSFENDLNSLKLAIRHQNIFPHLRHAAPVKLLEQGLWKSKKMPLQWTLVEGDFKSTMPHSPSPDIIYFDPFSIKTDKDSWSLTCFKNIYEVCQSKATVVYTYSSSTAVRALLLSAGFFVAKGYRTGNKSETTIALTPLAIQQESAYPVLNIQWLERWERSQAKFPDSLQSSDHSAFENSIRTHPQFNLT